MQFLICNYLDITACNYFIDTQGRFSYTPFTKRKFLSDKNIFQSSYLDVHIPDPEMERLT